MYYHTFFVKLLFCLAILFTHSFLWPTKCPIAFFCHTVEQDTVPKTIWISTINNKSVTAGADPTVQFMSGFWSICVAQYCMALQPDILVDQGIQAQLLCEVSDYFRDSVKYNSFVFLIFSLLPRFEPSVMHLKYQKCLPLQNFNCTKNSGVEEQSWLLCSRMEWCSTCGNFSKMGESRLAHSHYNFIF